MRSLKNSYEYKTIDKAGWSILLCTFPRSILLSLFLFSLATLEIVYALETCSGYEYGGNGSGSCDDECDECGSSSDDIDDVLASAETAGSSRFQDTAFRSVRKGGSRPSGGGQSDQGGQCDGVEPDPDDCSALNLHCNPSLYPYPEGCESLRPPSEDPATEELNKKKDELSGRIIECYEEHNDPLSDFSEAVCNANPFSNACDLSNSVEDDIKEDCSQKPTVVEKAKCVSDRVQEEGEKQNEEQRGDDESAEDTFVCRHHARCIDDLLEEIGVDDSEVNLGKPPGADGHAWTEVTLDNGCTLILDAYSDSNHMCCPSSPESSATEF